MNKVKWSENGSDNRKNPSFYKPPLMNDLQRDLLTINHKMILLLNGEPIFFEDMFNDIR